MNSTNFAHERVMERQARVRRDMRSAQQAFQFGNFRQTIGTALIEAGHRISGTRTPATVPARPQFAGSGQ